MRQSSKDKLKEIAKDHGGEILSKTFRNVHTKMRFRCKDRHTWWAFPFNINAGTWCPVCGNKRKGSTRKHGMDFIQGLAQEQGVECLSAEYVNGLSKLSWQCSKGHKFRESYHTVSRRRHWCKRCSKTMPNPELNLEKMKKLEKIAAKQGGNVLSETYVPGGKKMRFKCKNDHTWWAQPWEINKGTWCPKCFFEKMAQKYRLSINKMKEFAKSKGGKCLSTAEDYKNSFSNLKWECAEGHKFRGCYHITKRRKYFCKKCAGE